MTTTVPEFIGRMVTDRAFAEELQAQANAAVLGGQHSSAWAAYFGRPELAALATDPTKLASLGAVEGTAACTCNSTTVTTTTSPLCTATTTSSSG